MARVFVSHSSADRDVALLVHRRLVDAGHRVFVDVDQVDGTQGGQDWEARLYGELRAADVIVFAPRRSVSRALVRPIAPP